LDNKAHKKTTAGKNKKTSYKQDLIDNSYHEIRADFDDQGIWVYQAYNSSIADYALENQKLGGNGFNPTRMTWIKPSFALMLYRNGYGLKHSAGSSNDNQNAETKLGTSQERILKIKIPHHKFATILKQCACKHGGGGTKGRIQWDPERDIFSIEGNIKGKFEPRRMLNTRSIQIGISNELSAFFVDSVIKVEEVTDIAHQVYKVHKQSKTEKERSESIEELFRACVIPQERHYIPQMPEEELDRIQIRSARFFDSTNVSKLEKSS